MKIISRKRPVSHPCAAALALALSLTPAVGRADAVDLTVVVDGASTQGSFRSVEAAFGILGRETVASYFTGFAPGYTDASAASARITYLDVGVNYGFAAGSNTVTLSIPETGFTRSFTSDTRQNSNRLLREFLKANGDVLLQDIEKFRISNSPSSPVAGNPSSLQATLVDQGFAALTTEAPPPGGSAKTGLASTQVGFEAGTFSTGRLDGSNYTLPISTSFALGAKGNELRISAPLTYTLLDGSKVYSGSLGATYRMALTEQFSLQSGFSYGMVYSEDLLQFVQLASASVGASYRIDLGGATVTPAVLLGQVNSLGVKLSKYSFDPDIDSYTLKIGQIIENDVKLLGYPVRVQAFSAYTRLLGEDFAVQGYADFGVNFGLLAPAGNFLTRRMKAGVTVTASNSYSAARMSFGYTF